MAKWCLDYGHGGSDSGAIFGNRYEKNDVREIGNKIKELLIFNGEQVLLTRKNDEYVGLDERCNIANNWGANYFVSIHRNSFSNASANGLEVFSCNNAVNGKRLGINVLNSILEKVKFTNRGYKEEDYRVLINTNMTAILMELGFISNVNDNLVYDTNKDIIAEQIVKALLKEVGKVFKKPTPIQPEKPIQNGVMYRVVCGSFKDKNNANNRLEEVKKKTGLECFLLAEVIEGVSMYRVICGSFSEKRNAESRLNEVKNKTGLSCFLVAVKL